MARSYYIAPESFGFKKFNPPKEIWDYEKGWEPEDVEVFIKYLNLHIAKTPEIRENLRRGDTIDVIPKTERYKNILTSIWNGTEAIPLDDRLDDYGMLPTEFKIGSDNDFAIGWWDSVITNTTFYLSLDILIGLIFHLNDNGHYIASATLRWWCKNHQKSIVVLCGCNPQSITNRLTPEHVDDIIANTKGFGIDPDLYLGQNVIYLTAISHDITY